MNTQRKVDIVMNLFYNIILAVLLSVIAEMINAGGVTWPAIAIDSIISYILEMLIAIFLPFTTWGHIVGMKHAKEGTIKFRLIASFITAAPFATVMSLAMSFISTVVTLHLPIMVFVMAWLRIWLLFVLIAWICSFLLVPTFIELAKKVLKIPREFDPLHK